MTEQPRVFRQQPTDELPDQIVVAAPETAVRLLDAAPEHANEIYAGPVKPGTVLIFDTRKILEPSIRNPFDF